MHRAIICALIVIFSAIFFGGCSVETCQTYCNYGVSCPEFPIPVAGAPSSPPHVSVETCIEECEDTYKDWTNECQDGFDTFIGCVQNTCTDFDDLNPELHPCAEELDGWVRSC